MKKLFIPIACATFLSAGTFTLHSNIGGQLTKAQEYTGFGCNGQNISPELSWQNAPSNTKSFALTVYDPDAPTGSGWWHWLVVNMPATTNKIAQGASGNHNMPKGSVETMTDFGSPGFGGACPPAGDGAHRYIFTVYALDTDKLDITPKSGSALVGYMINAHTIQKSSIVSYYSREK